MELAIPDPYGLTASSALALARDRELLPTALSTADIQEQIAEGIRERSVFSARTTNAVYLSELKSRIERYLAAGYEGDLATLRTELKSELQRLGYTPETGFPGDAKLGIPAAKPGSLRDLSSERRINLILNTQLRLMTGRAQKIAGNDALALERYPAWELVRIMDRKAPRDWQQRWLQAGGVLTEDGRMIARKDDAIWSVIGDPAVFDDALGVDHPPFAFESGMGWQQIDSYEWDDLVQARSDAAPETRTEPMPEPAPEPAPTPEDLIPEQEISTDGLDRGILASIKRGIGNLIETTKKLTWRWIFGGKTP